MTAVAGSPLNNLSARLVEAQEEERRSISRELHDEVGQALTGVLVEWRTCRSLIRTGERGVGRQGGRDQAAKWRTRIGVVRNMALLLRPSMLDDLGLVPALQWQAREVSKRSGVWVKVDAAGVSEELPEEHKTCVYRIVQEALHNCVQHAAARNVKITVEQEDDGTAPGHRGRRQGVSARAAETRHGTVGHAGAGDASGRQPSRSNRRRRTARAELRCRWSCRLA